MDYECHHRQRLLEHAERIVDVLRGDGLVKGIMAAGSLAHGGTDRESDVDLLVIVGELPGVEARAAWLGDITGRPVDAAGLTGTEEREWDEFHWPKDEPEQWMGTGGGLFYFTQSEVEEAVNRTHELIVASIGRDRPETAGHLEYLLPDLAQGVVLHDPGGLLASCQQQLSRYPDSARAQLINYHWHRAEIAINEDVQRAVWRSDFLHAYDRRVEGVRHLVQMLFAMNRRYFRKTKGLEHTLSTFRRCPPNAWARLLAAMEEGDHLRAAMLLAFAGEMIDLIEPPDLLKGREHWRELCAHWAQEHLPR